MRADELGRRFRRRYPKVSLGLTILFCLGAAIGFAWRIGQLAPDSITDWVSIALGVLLAASVTLLWLYIAVIGRFGSSESTRRTLRALLWLTAALALAGSSWLYGFGLPETIQFVGAGFLAALFVFAIPLEIAHRRRPVLEASP